jgi:orotidine-5'-phosphate decarboxylase
VTTTTASAGTVPSPRSPLDGIAAAAAPPRERLIVALDFPTSREAFALADRLAGVVPWVKVGLELYIAEGNSLVAELKRRGFLVFLDLKLHDIPNTVGSAVASTARLGVNMLTVHAAGGSEMLTAAVQSARETDTGLSLLAVTVLTSMDETQIQATGISGTAAAQVERLADLAWMGGVAGMVCSPMEVASLRGRLGRKPLLVIPGIRPEGTALGDQRRVATPESAIAAGASYLVVGRPITRATDPVAAAKAILEQMA